MAVQVCRMGENQMTKEQEAQQAMGNAYMGGQINGVDNDKATTISKLLERVD